MLQRGHIRWQRWHFGGASKLGATHVGLFRLLVCLSSAVLLAARAPHPGLPEPFQHFT